MSSKRLAAVFSRCGLSSKARDLLAKCIGISSGVEPASEDMIRVEAVGSGAFIANIPWSENIYPYDLQTRVAAIVGKPLQSIGFTEGHGGVEFTRCVDECPKTTVFVMYYKMCSRCCVNIASEFVNGLGLVCSDCAAEYRRAHRDYPEERPFPRLIWRRIHLPRILKTRQ
jgi:hypothetical protein